MPPFNMPGSLVISFSFLLFIASATFACDKTPLDPAAAWHEADVVFHGKVETIQYLDDPQQTKTEPRIIVSFKVFEVWKGQLDKHVNLHTTHNKTSCNGFVFNSAEEYLIYARFNRRADNFFARWFAPDQPTLGVKVYAGTKLLSQASKDLKRLIKQQDNHPKN